MSNSIDQGTSQSVVHDETTEAEERVNEGGGEYRYKSGVEAEEMQGDKELDEVPTTSLPYAVNPASAKKVFGTIKRPSLTAKKGAEIAWFFAVYLRDALQRTTYSITRENTQRMPSMKRRRPMRESGEPTKTKARATMPTWSKNLGTTWTSCWSS